MGAVVAHASLIMNITNIIATQFTHALHITIPTAGKQRLDSTIQAFTISATIRVHLLQIAKIMLAVELSFTY